MNTQPAYQLDGIGVSHAAFYAAACDPRRHVVVEACAGAGKTWMLVARIVRALVEGAQPQEILAITFTRKAAGEMRTRLAQWLRAFALLTPEQARAQLIEFGVASSQADAQADALIGLHERVLDSARAVQVSTFHAWYAQLLRAAPMQLLASLGLSPGLTPIEDIADIEPELMRAFHAALLADDALREDHRRLSVRHGRSLLQHWLAAALERRVEIQLADADGVLEASVEPAADPQALSRIDGAAFIAEVRAFAATLGISKGAKAHEAARGLIDALAVADLRRRFTALCKTLFTQKGTPRKHLGNLAVQQRLCEALDAIGRELAQQDACEDHLAMTRLSRVLFAQYAALKRRRALIDMADLERVALALLAEHELSGWVQERLDARVRHLLIDEFQDTSPLQWHALHAWLAAYAGAGGGAPAPRLFIVGDPKQSIYRFRRAEPRVFEAAQHFVVEALGGTRAACDHTRRCAPGVVGVLNEVFATIAAQGRLEGWRPHTTDVASTGAAPLMCLASAQREARVAASASADDEPVWRPSLTTPRIEPKVVLRDAEAGELALAIEQLVQREGVAPRDILVLARTHDVLTRAAEALAARHLPHVAPEALRLAALPEVQDLLAVLDVLASPGQALSLARALKSPLMGVSDAELLQIAQAAKEVGAWWPALMSCRDGACETLSRAARLFAAWREAAAVLPPHDLLDRIVHEGDLVPRLAAAVPPERHARAMEAVRALLAAALELDGGRYASPYGFVRALRSRAVLAPAPQRDEAVRLLTIHGAKGLEARVVFLMDTDPQPRNPESATLLIEWPVQALRPRRVAFVASEARCPPSLQTLLDEERAARSREEVNALYVALTRAEERIVVSRTPPLRHGDTPSWWAWLEPLAQPWQQAPEQERSAREDEARHIALPLPTRRAAVATPAAPQRDDSAARLGQAVHRTLEWAAGRSDTDLSHLARAAAEQFGAVDASAVQAIAARILASPACRRFFDAASIAWSGSEVPVAGADGQVRRIDRLVRLNGEGAAWWVLDYKLSGTPQADPALREQLAAYRDAVAALVPGEPVRAAFVTGAGELQELAH